MVRARAHGTRGDDANATAIVPHDYYCMVGNDGKRYDANERVELCKGCVEFIAPAEYMMRPPQPHRLLLAAMVDRLSTDRVRSSDRVFVS